jgi:hypothetical protein
LQFIEQSTGDAVSLNSETPVDKTPKNPFSNMKFDIHNKSGELSKTLERIKESKEITERNKTVISDWWIHDHMS